MERLIKPLHNTPSPTGVLGESDPPENRCVSLNASPTISPTVLKPYYEHAGIQIFHGDCREVLPQLGLMVGCFVLADPPYGAGLSFDYNQRFSHGDQFQRRGAHAK